MLPGWEVQLFHWHHTKVVTFGGSSGICSMQSMDSKPWELSKCHKWVSVLGQTKKSSFGLLKSARSFNPRVLGSNTG